MERGETSLDKQWMALWLKERKLKRVNGRQCVGNNYIEIFNIHGFDFLILSKDVRSCQMILFI